MIGYVPLVYYLALFGDCCVAIYCFCSGYGLMIGYKNNRRMYLKRNVNRITSLYLNFGVIVFLFVVVLGPLLGRGTEYPGYIKTLLLTASGLAPAYNEAWWFFTTYIILVILSPFINRVVLKYHPVLILAFSLGFYFIGYVQRIMVPIVYDQVVLDWD